MSFEIIASILLGLGLSSAVGFRIFVPALITSVASHFNYIELSDSMDWMGSIPAMATFGVATALEIFAYYIPFIDNALDVVAVPIAAICGSLLMGSTIIEMDPLIKWPLSIIAGGGMATAVHSGTSLVRAKSCGLTGGLGNPIVSSIEGVFAAILSVISIFLPIVAGVVILWLIFKILKDRRKD